MNTYKVKSLHVTGKCNKIFSAGDTVTENDFAPGRAEILWNHNHLTKITEPSPPIKIGVLIPTRGDRKVFLKQAGKLLSRQTLMPDVIEVVDDEPLTNDIDITYRYRIGCQRLFNKGCGVVIFWEDDDWYSRDYIAIMMDNWGKSGKPPIFGIGSTTYYHVLDLKYLTIAHKDRASAMATMVTNAVLNVKWGRDNDAYTDVVIWKQLRGKTFLPPFPICLGIKHNIGMVGGGGHDTTNYTHYNQTDPNKAFLKSIVGPDFSFYNDILNQPAEENPFLSIITRKYKRPHGLSKNLESVKALSDQDYEQIFITDDVGKGLLEANRSFQDVSPSGYMVFLLDDDDFIVNPDMIAELKAIVKDHNPDVIFFRMIIKNNMNNNWYPTDELCWGNRPVIARIGGSCFVVKNHIYKKFIHNFAHARCGDFYFINAVFESGAKCYWHDKLMCETGRVSRGKPEVA